MDILLSSLKNSGMIIMEWCPVDQIVFVVFVFCSWFLHPTYILSRNVDAAFVPAEPSSHGMGVWKVKDINLIGYASTAPSFLKSVSGMRQQQILHCCSRRPRKLLFSSSLLPKVISQTVGIQFGLFCKQPKCQSNNNLYSDIY